MRRRRGVRWRCHRTGRCSTTPTGRTSSRSRPTPGAPSACYAATLTRSTAASFIRTSRYSSPAHSCDKGANSHAHTAHTAHDTQELYSGGNDNQLLCWVPSMDEAELVEDEAADEGDERRQSSAAAHAQDVDADAWSDDEDEGEDEVDQR